MKPLTLPFRITPTVLLAAMLLLAACAPKHARIEHPAPPAPPQQAVEAPTEEVPAEVPVSREISDLATMTQDLNAYAGANAQVPLLPADAQAAAASDWVDHFFRPWSRTRADNGALNDTLATIASMRRKHTFGENLRERKPTWYDLLERNADMGTYPNTNQRAIAVYSTSLRLLPTDKPSFYNPAQPGEGYPFDNLQNSGIWAGTPLFVSHTSRDGAWVLAEGPFASGWVPVKDIAFVDDEFIRRYKTGRYMVAIKDDVPLKDDAGVHRGIGRIGMVLPSLGGNALVPGTESSRRAIISTVRVDSSSFAPMPLPFTPAWVASVGNEIMGEPYGWGGFLGNRDCSAMMRDVFTPFGLWLPRNSAAQAKHGGAYIPLSGLSADAKARTIIERGIPFMTLLSMRGHIMLYIGSQNGKPLVFQDVWGLRTRDPNSPNGKGRRIIGGAVVTTASPGLELPELKLPEGNLLERIDGMTILGQNGKNGKANGNGR